MAIVTARWNLLRGRREYLTFEAQNSRSFVLVSLGVCEFAISALMESYASIRNGYSRQE
jgi:hypothetical protein